MMMAVIEAVMVVLASSRSGGGEKHDDVGRRSGVESGVIGGNAGWSG